MLEALGGQASGVTTRVSGGNDHAIINIHVDVAANDLLRREEKGGCVNGGEDG